MKKILFAILGVALLAVSCGKVKEEANPYRKVVDYKPSTFTMTVPGNLTPINASWITMTQSGTTATFTTKLNTTGLVRRAEFPIAGGGVCVISQKTQDLDAALALSVAAFGDDYATIAVDVNTSNLDDYAGWGVLFSKENDKSKATKQSGTTALVAGKNKITLSNLEKNTMYYIWGYVESLEGMKVESDKPFGFIKPIVVAQGEDLQAAINSAPAYSEVRVAAGAVFPGGVCLKADVTVSGGWENGFTEQNVDKKSVIDGNNTVNCVFVGFNPQTKVKEPLESPATISNFELRNGYANDIVNKGGGIYVCGDVIVDNCYIHDNTSTNRGGALLTAEGVDGTCIVKNSIIKDNVSTGHHAGGFCFDGEANQKVYLINNLITGNFAKKFDGYCAAVMIYKNVEMYMINNTITANKNYDENDGSPWFCIQTREQIKMFMVNNIVAGNLSAIKDNPDVFYRQAYQAKLDCVVREDCVVRSNIIEGGIYGDGKPEPDAEKGNIIPKVGFDLTTIFADPAKGDYMPKGDALNGDYSDDVAKIMKDYGKDLLGKNRVVDGKINMGCYQVQ